MLLQHALSTLFYLCSNFIGSFVLLFIRLIYNVVGSWFLYIILKWTLIYSIKTAYHTESMVFNKLLSPLITAMVMNKVIGL